MHRPGQNPTRVCQLILWSILEQVAVAWKFIFWKVTNYMHRYRKNMYWSTHLSIITSKLQWAFLTWIAPMLSSTPTQAGLQRLLLETTCWKQFKMLVWTHITFSSHLISSALLKRPCASLSFSHSISWSLRNFFWLFSTMAHCHGAYLYFATFDYKLLFSELPVFSMLEFNFLSIGSPVWNLVALLKMKKKISKLK